MVGRCLERACSSNLIEETIDFLLENAQRNPSAHIFAEK
jgi:hypothetical protein